MRMKQVVQVRWDLLSLANSIAQFPTAWVVDSYEKKITLRK